MLYRICSSKEWESARKSEMYAPADLMSGGFVHLCEASQVPFVAERHFRGRKDLLVLEIDPERVSCEIRYEQSEPGLAPFPHAYGAIPVQAVVGCADLDRFLLLGILNTPS